MGLLKWAIDRQNQVLASYLGASTKIPDFFQSNVKNLRIQVLDPLNPLGGDSGFQVPDLNGYSMRVSVGPTPTGDAGGPTVLALATLTWNATSNWFEGDLALNTTSIDTYIGSAASKSAYLEVNITNTSGRDTIFQSQVNLKAVVDELTSTSPSPTDQYFTKAEILAMFVKKVGLAGETFLTTSPTTGKTTEWGTNDDGTAMMNAS